MKTKTAVFLLLLLITTMTALASTPFEQKPLASGFVSSVNRFSGVITINGILAVSTLGADFRGPAPNDHSSFDAVVPGVQVAVVFREGTYPPGAPIPATIVQVLRQPVGTMTGKVESIDLAANTFTLLGQPIHVTPSTIYGGSIPSLDPDNLGELPLGKDITVFFDGDMTSLTAQRIYVISPFPDQVLSITGTVKRIRGDTWELINSQVPSFRTTSLTTIEGNPRVGNNVRVMARVDDGEVTAESIELAPTQCPNFTPNPRISIRGYVTAINATSMRVQTGEDEFVVRLNDQTLYAGDADPVVGNNVDIDAERINNEYVARIVTTVNERIQIFIHGPVTAINGSDWTINGFHVTVNDKTTIRGTINVGDRVLVIAQREPNGTIIANDIQKDPRP